MWQEFKKFLETKTELSPLSIKAYVMDIKACEDAYGSLIGDTVEDYVISANCKATRYRRYHSVQRYLRWAVQTKKLKPEQATMTLEAPSKPKRVSKAIDEEEYGALMKAVVASEALTEQDKTFFMVLAATGRRASEILTIYREDVKLLDGCIRLKIKPKGSENYSGETWVYQEDHEAFTRLLEHLNRVDKGYLKHLFDYPGDDPYQTVYYLWRTYVSDQYTMHQLRHTALTKTANTPGAGPMVAQIQAGHKSIETTMGYVKVYSSTYHDAMRIVKKA